MKALISVLSEYANNIIYFSRKNFGKLGTLLNVVTILAVSFLDLKPVYIIIIALCVPFISTLIRDLCNKVNNINNGENVPLKRFTELNNGTIRLIDGYEEEAIQFLYDLEITYESKGFYNKNEVEKK